MENGQYIFTGGKLSFNNFCGKRKWWVKQCSINQSRLLHECSPSVRTGLARKETCLMEKHCAWVRGVCMALRFVAVFSSEHWNQDLTQVGRCCTTELLFLVKTVSHQLAPSSLRFPPEARVSQNPPVHQVVGIWRHNRRSHTSLNNIPRQNNLSQPNLWKWKPLEELAYAPVVTSDQDGLMQWVHADSTRKGELGVD